MKPSDTSSEEYRFQCEARHVYALRVKGRQEAINYLSLVRERRGDDAANKLQQEAAKLWEKR